MDLFTALPQLHKHPALAGQAISMIGISAFLSHEHSYIFELQKRRYWKPNRDGAVTVGVGAIGGSPRSGESLSGALRRMVTAGLGARLRLDEVQDTLLFRDWRVVGRITSPQSKKRPTPLMVILVPPRLGGVGTPDHLALAAFSGQIRGAWSPGAVPGILTVEAQSLRAYFDRDEWPISDLGNLPGVTLLPREALFPETVLRPVLTVRALQTAVRERLFPL
jgi:hypothetical protein